MEADWDEVRSKLPLNHHNAAVKDTTAHYFLYILRMHIKRTIPPVQHTNGALW